MTAVTLTATDMARLKAATATTVQRLLETTSDATIWDLLGAIEHGSCFPVSDTLTLDLMGADLEELAEQSGEIGDADSNESRLAGWWHDSCHRIGPLWVVRHIDHVGTTTYPDWFADSDRERGFQRTTAAWIAGFAPPFPFSFSAHFRDEACFVRAQVQKLLAWVSDLEDEVERRDRCAWDADDTDAVDEHLLSIWNWAVVSVPPEVLPGRTASFDGSSAVDAWLDTHELQWKDTLAPLSAQESHCLRLLCRYLLHV
jgi:hypothetical protein